MVESLAREQDAALIDDRLHVYKTISAINASSNDYRSKTKVTKSTQKIVPIVDRVASALLCCGWVPGSSERF
jgi:hypothetical protein